MTNGSLFSYIGYRRVTFFPPTVTKRFNHFCSQHILYLGEEGGRICAIVSHRMHCVRGCLLTVIYFQSGIKVKLLLCTAGSFIKW